MNQESDLARVKEACNALIEHYDSVHIFVTRHESGESNGTINISYGLGNWFTRRGQIGTWLIKEDEVSKEDVRARDNGAT